jgi:hypothetical protein
VLEQDAIVFEKHVLNALEAFFHAPFQFCDACVRLALARHESGLIVNQERHRFFEASVSICFGACHVDSRGNFGYWHAQLYATATRTVRYFSSAQFAVGPGQISRLTCTMTLRISFRRCIVCTCVLAALADGSASAEEDPPREKKTPLESLKERCWKIRDLEIELRIRTKQLHKTIEASPTKKASPADLQAAVMLSEFQTTMIAEVDSAIKILEIEGSAIAFLEVFRQVRTDMENVQRFLAAGDVGVKTHELQTDIIDTFSEMIDALTKPRSEKRR